MINAKWSKKKDGFFKIWVNGELKYEYNGATTGGKESYFKFGIYHTKVSVWQMYHPNEPYPTQVIYYDEVRVGKNKKIVTKYLGN